MLHWIWNPVLENDSGNVAVGEASGTNDGCAYCFPCAYDMENRSVITRRSTQGSYYRRS